MESISVILWRFTRGAVATAIAQTAVMPINFSDPQEAIRLIFISFVSGFLLALSKAVRNSEMSTKAPILEKLPV